MISTCHNINATPHSPLQRSIVKLSVLILLLILHSQSHASDGSQGAASAGWKSSVTAAFAWQGDTNIDSGGEFSVNRGVLQFDSRRLVGSRLFTGITLGYEQDDYKFSSLSAQPWNDIRTLQFGLSLRYLATDKWSLFGLPLLRYSSEKGKDLSDGREYGLLAGASYRFSENLTLGPGFGVISGIGGEEDIFPILLVNWKITDTVSVETGRGLAASRGPGLALKWKPASQWELSLAARYEKSRFRLATDNNIGEDRSVPVLLTASWRHNRHFSVTGFTGFETAGKLSLENSNGDEIESLEYDTAPLAGLLARFSF
jgi:hypothetical protein